MDAEAVERQFNLVAGEYDSGRRKFIPCFDAYYEKTTSLVISMAGKPRRIIDLGAGTGLLAMYYYRHLPEAEYLLVDVAEEMLRVAEKRFAGSGNVRFLVADYTQYLPEMEFDLAISALSIHHLENEQKRALFKKLHQRLAPGNWFINYDQFCSADPELDALITRYWVENLYRSGLSENELARWQERRKLDRECSVQEELSMLRQSGFSSVECIFLDGKFAVIAARA